jgi:hypothetical protein
VSDGFDVDALIASAAPAHVEVSVCGRGDLVDRHAELVVELAAATASSSGSLAGNKDVDRLLKAVAACEKEQEGSTLTFTLHSVSRTKWADCLAAHPPRRGVDRGDHNPETFQPAAVALCCDTVTEPQAAKLAEVLPLGEWDKLWGAVVQLNLVKLPHPKLRAATETARANGNS